MLVGLLLITGTLVAWALGARLSMLAELRFRGDLLVFGSLAVQIAIFTPGGVVLADNTLSLVHMGTYAMLILFVLLNMRVPGFWLLGLGLASNVVVIFANGGQMPVSVDAWRSLGLSMNDLVKSNASPAGPGTHVAWLGDIFAIPQVPRASVISIGDVLMLAGAIAFTYRSCTPRLKRTASLAAPLRVPEFRRVVAARFVSGVGDWLTQAAAVTWIYSETRSTAMVSIYLVLGIGAFVIGGIAAAPRLDRLSGFRVLSTIELSRGLLGALMIPMAMTGRLWPVIGLAALSSFLSAATNPSAASLVPEVLPPDQLQTGNTLHHLSRTATMIFGAAGGGALVGMFGISTALSVDFVTFLVAALLYRRFAARSGAPAESPSRGAPSRRELAVALVRSPAVLGLTLSFTVVTAALGLLNSSLPALFDLRFRNASAYGYAMAAIGMGYLAGELVTGFMQRQSVARRSISLAFLMCGGAVYILSYAQMPATAYLMLFVLGAADGTTEIVHDTLMQLHVPRRIRAGLFALTDSVKTLGMVAGLAAAPLVERAYSTAGSVRLTALGCLAGSGLALLVLISRGRLAQDDEESLHGPSAVTAPTAPPPTAPALDQPVPAAAFALAAGGDSITAQRLVAEGPAVFALLGSGSPAAERLVMLQELVASGATVYAVAPAEQAPAAADGVPWLLDPSGAAFRSFGLTRERSGLFVLDREAVLRLAFAEPDEGGWVPASIVRSRLSRMTAAAA